MSDVFLLRRRKDTEIRSVLALVKLRVPDFALRCVYFKAA